MLTNFFGRFCWSSGGRLLSVDEIWNDVSNAFKSHLSQANISQAEHPILGVPFYFLHPCNSGEAMAILRGENADDGDGALGYVHHWMSWVCPIFQIPVPMMV